MTGGEGYRDLHIELTCTEKFDTNIRIKLANLVDLCASLSRVVIDEC